MSKIYKGAIELVGNTPLVEVTNIEEGAAESASSGEAGILQSGRER